MTPVLEIRDLSTHIQLTKSVVHAVGNVDLSIEPGEALGLVGESGCGKSMTGLSIMGLLPPGGKIIGGSIKLDGRELVGLSDAELDAVVGNAAVARHIYLAESEQDGKATTTRIGVLQVWQKQDGAWKLLARQGFTLPA